jgi:cytochrome c oxidase subunit 4
VSTAVDHGHTDVEHDHPSDSLYIKVALILGAITAAEVATFYVDIGKVMVPALVIMMIAKFSIVAGYFMHLKYDATIFTRVFVSGVLLAVGVYIVAVTSLHVWVH